MKKLIKTTQIGWLNLRCVELTVPTVTCKKSEKLFKLLLFPLFRIAALSIIAFLLHSCENNAILYASAAQKTDTRDFSHSEAAVIASKCLYGEDTRSGTHQFSVSYITSMATRSASNDTIAYILNDNDGGFVVVSKERLTNPVLAFSEEGNFYYEESEEDNVFSNFVQPLVNNYEAFRSMNANSMPIILQGPSLSISPNVGVCFSRPLLRKSLKQNSPYNKYVETEHPIGTLAGCVAVATCQIMTHCKDSLIFHEANLNMQSIRDGQIAQKLINQEYQPDSAKIVESIDSIAKILYWIGIDLNLDYVSKWPLALGYTYNARNYLVCLGYDVKNAYSSYDPEEALGYMKNNCLIYMDGRREDHTGGHAWIIDGFEYLFYTTAPEEPLDIYFHCDWGEGGECNGYYTGNVFSLPTIDYSINKYFAVGISGYLPHIIEHRHSSGFAP